MYRPAEIDPKDWLKLVNAVLCLNSLYTELLYNRLSYIDKLRTVRGRSVGKNMIQISSFHPRANLKISTRAARQTSSVICSLSPRH